MSSDSDAEVLLAHDGELDDVRDLLSELGLAVVERRSEDEPDQPGGPWALVLATPHRLLKLDLQPSSDSNCVQIAIGEGDSRTLRSTMRQRSVDFFVRRPVHADALRLLIAHSLYRGPEKRRARRVAAGSTVHFRTALRRHSAILLDLSESGCRMVSEHASDPGIGIKLTIPGVRNRSMPLVVRGTILRTLPSESGSPESRVMRVRFDDLSRAQKSRLREIVDELSEGPASLPEPQADGRGDEDLPADRGPRRKESTPAPLRADLERFRRDAPVRTKPAPDATMRTKAAPDATAPKATAAPDPDGDAADSRDDRRAESRHIFSQELAAMANQRHHILVARDVSVSGMRTDPNPNVAVGDELTVALPLVVGKVPLVIKAHVIRDDGDSGLVLQFRDVSPEAAAFLRQKTKLLPICDSPFAEEEPAWVIVSEILASG